MDRLINKIIRIFKKRYFVVVFLFVCIITLLGVTYSYWTAESGWKLASQIKFKELTYIMNIDDVNVSTINVSANSGTTYYDIEITSLNEINTRYLLVYNSDVSTVEVALSSSSINDASGVIGLYESGAGGEKTKNIRIAITNETSSAAIIELEVVGGYTWNPESAIDVTTGYNRIDEIHDEVITRGLTLAEELNQIMGCTPTSSSACLMKENSANYLTYSSKSWRIIGTYLVGGEYVTKLILNEPLTTKVTYANSASELTTFYNTLDTSLIKTSAPFVCTGTTNIACTGSANIGLISKAEYDAIKGVNSYLYTKPNKEYWLNDTYYTGTSRGAVNTDSSSLAYVRPVIYLKSNTIETAKSSTSTSITNLVTNGGFENGTTGWTNHASAYVTTSSNDYSNGNYSLKVEFTSASSALIDSSQMSTPVGHIIYAKGAYKITSISATQPLGEIYGITDSVTYWQPGSINPSINNTGAWFTISTRFTSQHPTSFIRLGFWNANNQNYTGYHDDVMLIDLTATFGAGNEPSKAWCDENLEYFDGTTTINTKVGTVGTSGTPYVVTAGIQLIVNLDGGSSNIKTGYYQSGATYTFTTPTKSGSAFTGWTVSGTGTSISGTTLTMGSASSTLLATWTSDFTLTYNNQSGSGCTTKTVTYNEQYGTLCTPARTNYTFSGWYTGTGGSGTQITATSTVTTASNHTIYAKWVAIPVSSIAVTTQPTTTTYAEGATFSNSGMVVTATYTDGTSQNVTGYVTSPSTVSFSTTYITISYTWGGVTKTTTVPVVATRTVTVALTSARSIYEYSNGTTYTNLKVGSESTATREYAILAKHNFSTYHGYTVASATYTFTATMDSTTTGNPNVYAIRAADTSATAVTWASKPVGLRYTSSGVTTLSSTGTYNVPATYAVQQLVDFGDTGDYGILLAVSNPTTTYTIYAITNLSLSMTYSNITRDGTWTRVPASAQTSDSKSSASSVYSSSYAAYKAFDYNSSVAWATANNASNPYIQYDLSTSYKNIIVDINNRIRTSLVNGPNSYYFLVSNDGSTWYNPDGTSSSVTANRVSVTDTYGAYSPGEYAYYGGRSISLGNTTAYRYVRIYFTDWANRTESSNNYLSVGEIRFWGST